MNPADLMDLFGLSTGMVERLALVMSRVTGLFLAAPFFSRGVGPFRIRVALIVLITLAIGPNVPPWSGEGQGNYLAMSLAVITELLMGILMGIMVHWALVALQTAGNVIGFEMGLSIAQVMDPTSGMQENVISNLLYMAGLMIFLSIDGHHLLLEGLVRSFQTYPPGKGLPPWGAILEAGVSGIARYFVFSLLVAAPVIVGSKLLYLGLGLINRAAPQIQVFFIAMPISLMLGFLLVGLTMAIFGQVLVRELNAFIALAFHLTGAQ